MRVRAFSSCAGLLLAFARSGLAETQPPSVWYRASEACPNGAQFLDKLAENSRRARLAQAGDHIDFVVTLVADSKQTVGRLERQTDSGIVAIRELHDATCEQVADALALSLGLALTPGANSEPGIENSSGAPPAVIDAAPSNNMEAQREPPLATPPSAPTVAVSPSPAPAAPPEDARKSGPQWSLGLGIGPMIG